MPADFTRVAMAALAAGADLLMGEVPPEVPVPALAVSDPRHARADGFAPGVYGAIVRQTPGPR